MGHGGASGYLAVMALVGLSPIVMKPTALVLNIVVTTIAMARYGKAGAFDWGALWPFLVGSVPLAVFGGAVHLPGNIYKPVVGIILLIAAIRLLWPTKGKAAPTAGANGLPIPPAVVSGAGIGFLSGLTGTGGGIFLSPLLLFTGWLDPRRTAGVSAGFILPSVVARAQLVEANGALASSTAFLAIAGPGAAGGLIQLLGAPKAIIIDAAAYVGSALALGTTGATESVPRRLPVRGHMNAEIGAGLRALLRTPLLCALTASSSVGSFFLAVQSPVFVLFLTRELGFTAATLGLVFACGGGGTLLGALLAGRVAQRLGPGRAIVMGTSFGAVGGLCVPLAGFVGLGLPLVATGQVLTGLGASLYGVNQLSLRQHLTPPTLLGRVNAARRFLVFGTAPLGAAAGGVLGGTLGLRPALLVGAIGFVAALLLILCSPVRSVRDTVGLGACRPTEQHRSAVPVPPAPSAGRAILPNHAPVSPGARPTCVQPHIWPRVLPYAR